MRRRSFAVKLGAGVAAATISMFGLAFAGHQLATAPDEEDVDKVLAEKSEEAEAEQETEEDDADAAAKARGEGGETHGSLVSAFASNPEKETGCEFGQAVSELASSKSLEHRQDDADKNDPCDKTAEATEAEGEDEEVEEPEEAVEAAPGKGKPKDDSDDDEAQKEAPAGGKEFGQSHKPSGE